jgi:uncharacterized protein (TIGR02271 family)
VFETSSLRRVAGKHVVGPDGERIGKVVDVYESTAEDGGGTFATVTTGLLGTSTSFFPLDTAQLRDDEIVIPYTKDFVKQAPRVADDDELTADEEQRLFAYYGLTGDDADVTAADDSGRPVGSGPADGTITRSEERLRVGTERVEVGRARLRKHVVTETVTRTVPVTHEELHVTREPITDGGSPTAVSSLSEEEHEIVLTAERPVVHKDVVPVERVRLHTVSVSEQETVTEQVRKEQIEVDGDVEVEVLGGDATGQPGSHPLAP